MKSLYQIARLGRVIKSMKTFQNYSVGQRDSNTYLLRNDLDCGMVNAGMRSLALDPISMHLAGLSWFRLIPPYVLHLLIVPVDRVSLTKLMEPFSGGDV
jgi:hypothetical protein